MAASIAFRLTIFEVDGTTPLAESGTDAKFSTEVASGWLPYLEVPRAEVFAVNWLSAQPVTASLALAIGDFRITEGGSNAARQVTRFIADSDGNSRLTGKPCLVERSVDGGAFASWFRGKIFDVATTSRIGMTLTVRDSSADYDSMIFVESPYADVASYAFRPSILPIAMVQGEGQSYMGMVEVAKGVATTSAAPGFFGLSIGKDITMLLPSVPRVDMVYSKDFFDRLTSQIAVLNADSGAYEVRSDRLRLHIKMTGSPFTEAHYSVRGASSDGRSLLTAAFIDANGSWHPTMINYVTLPTDDEQYSAIDAIADDEEVSFWVEPRGPATKDAPILIDNVNAVLLWQHILEGKWSRRNLDASVVFTSPFNATAFNLLNTDARYDGRFRIESSESANDFIVNQIMRPFNLSMRLNGDGEVVPFSLNQPDTVQVVTELNTGLQSAADVAKWRIDRGSAMAGVIGTHYVDEQDNNPQEWSGEKVKAIAGRLLPAVPLKFAIADFSDLDIVDQVYEIEYTGVRGFGEDYLGLFDNRARCAAFLEEIRALFGHGEAVMSLEMDRSATTSALVGGELVLLNIPEVPNMGTNLRGGVRLCRIKSIHEDAKSIGVQVTDLGANTVAASPSLAAPVATTGAEESQIDINVTRNGSGDPVSLYCAETTTAVGTVPVETSELWLPVRLGINANGVVTIQNRRNGMRHWFRARTMLSPAATGGLQLPSPWVFPSGSGYADTTALPQPSGLGVTEENAAGGLLTWTNTDTDMEIEVLAIETGGTLQRFRRVLAGTTTFRFRRLQPSTGYDVGVRYVVGSHYGPTTTDTLTTTGSTGATAPAPAGISVRVGDSTAPGVRSIS